MNPRSLIPTIVVEKNYIRAGAEVGDWFSYGAQIKESDSVFKKWRAYEEEYSSRGFRTISLDEFIAYGGYERDISHLLRQERESGEEPILHAERYLKIYKDHPLSITTRTSNGITFGSYEIPSTE